MRHDDLLSGRNQYGDVGFSGGSTSSAIPDYQQASDRNTGFSTTQKIGGLLALGGLAVMVINPRTAVKMAKETAKTAAKSAPKAKPSPETVAKAEATAGKKEDTNCVFEKAKQNFDGKASGFSWKDMKAPGMDDIRKQREAMMKNMNSGGLKNESITDFVKKTQESFDKMAKEQQSKSGSRSGPPSSNDSKTSFSQMFAQFSKDSKGQQEQFSKMREEFQKSADEFKKNAEKMRDDAQKASGGTAKSKAGEGTGPGKTGQMNFFEKFMDETFGDFMSGHTTGGFEKVDDKKGMSVQEARKILQFDAGNPNIQKEEITKNFRVISRANHPDLGGSPYVAAKINEARETLLKHYKRTNRRR